MHHRVIILGNLGRDPELRYTPTGKAVCDFSVATNRNWTNADGTAESEVCWFRVTAWGKLAELFNQYLAKGEAVYVEGRLNPDNASGGPRTYTRQDGTCGASYEVTAETVRFLGRRTAESGGEAEGDAQDELPF
jgi:single-strand DNA-binding protein